MDIRDFYLPESDFAGKSAGHCVSLDNAWTNQIGYKRNNKAAKSSLFMSGDTSLPCDFII